MFYVFEFDAGMEDWKVMAHSDNVAEATGAARDLSCASCYPVVVADGVHPENQALCEKHLGREIDPSEFGNLGAHIATFVAGAERK